MNSNVTGKGAADVHKVLSKKSIDVKKKHCHFCNKQRLLRIEMKTKVVQHVESD